MTAGRHPHVAAALAGGLPGEATPDQRFEDVLSRVLVGLLGPDD